jgi:hypothetical protein
MSLAGAFLLPLHLSAVQTANVVNINLFGSASQGWGFTADTLSNPGRT